MGGKGVKRFPILLLSQSKIMPLPILLNTYLAAEIMAPFLAAFVIVNALLLFGQIIPMLNLILNLGIGFADLLRLIAYLWPKLLVYSIPMAGMTAVILAFSRLTNDGEIMAMKSCGLGVRRFVFAVAAFAFLLSAISAYASVSLAPAGEINIKKLLFNLAKDKFDRGMKEKYFSEGTGNFVIYVENIDPVSGLWHGVFLSDTRDPKSPISILARSGMFSADSGNFSIALSLQNGSIHRITGQTVQTVFFEKYGLSIPLPLPRFIGGEDIQAIGKRGMSLDRLRQKAKAAGSETPAGISFLVEFHKRLATPVGCFLLCLLGMPLGLLAGPGKRAIGLPIGILLFLGYFILLAAGKALSEGSIAPVWLAIWGADSLYALICALLLYLAAKEKLPLLFAWLQNLYNKMTCMLPPCGQKKGSTP